MSGDVQPRKRKDKKKMKRDSLDRRSEGDIFTRKLSAKDDEEVKESHHGVNAEKLGKDDVLLHVHDEHGTGGHWCAKLLFFSLMAILFGIVGLIILENRGSSDIDTPLSESRFSEYFEGWVDEHRQAHDDHHEAKTGLEDHDSGPFEEEEDHSEQADDDDDHDVDHGDDHDEEGDEDEAHDEEERNDEEDDDEGDDAIEPEYVKEEANPTENARSKRDAANGAVDEDEGYEEGANDDDNNEDEGDTNNEDENDEENPEDDAPFDESKTNKPESTVKLDLLIDEPKKSVQTSDDKKLNEVGNEDKQTMPNTKDTLALDVPLKTTKDDEDFDDADESLEKVVDNDAGEELHLRQKAEQEERAAKAAVQEDEETESAPLAVKVAVGLALAFVARLVLVKKTKPSKPDEPVQGSPLARRRFTMISAEDDVPVENVEIADEEMIEDDYLDEGDDEDPELQYSDEYDEEDEEDVEELEDDEEVVLGEEQVQEKNVRIEKYIPETFEQLNAMYRPQPSEVRVETTPIERPFEASINLTQKAQLPPKLEPKQPVIDNVPKMVPSHAQVITNIYHGDQIPKKYAEQPASIADDDLEAEEELVDDEELYDEEIYSGSEEEVEDDVSDIDDDDLMKRLEAKYGKLPERQYDSDEDDPDEQSWTKVRGPQSYIDDDSFIDEEIRRANEELFNDNLKSSLQIYESLTLKFPEHPGALYGKAKVLDRLSAKYRSNEMLGDAIDAYRAVINLGDKISDEMFREAAERCLERLRFRGMLTQAVPIHRMLIRRFSNDPEVRNQLAVTYLMLNRYAEAKYILHHTLMRWRDNGFAQVHYGFILKVHDNDLKGSVALLREGIASGENGTQDGRFYFTLGDALQRLGETKEALEVYQKGADLKLFPSVYQRSLYNVDGLKAQPFWTQQETTYEKELYLLQRNWELIQKEGLSALKNEGLYKNESESLRETGDWKQLELFARGSRIEKNCVKTPFTCNIIETFPAARTCKRGQVKFSIMQPGTHVWPHCGPTNCRLRGHLGLVVPSGTKLRVATEERTWSAGKWLIFDDSFEHEVWHNGSSPRLVLIVDMWHPEVTEAQRDSLSRI